ncbi:MAG TPA: dihydrolipoamide acetyltransferase family protein [Steroidobacteraceae bacterium]|jgi:2-oxoisovalerate dehydrogenase E2 component (dihydrolipoyl transacylase)|nr:dihydrolipoamide acetyltransferase family protein [Steroidobacteraceae bacterium]
MSQFIFKMPDLGEGTVDAEIVAWHTKPGDTVSEDQLIVEVMTDKAAVEVPAPVSGRVLSVTGAPGDKVAVGSPLIVFELSEGANPAATVAASAAPTTPAVTAAVTTAPAVKPAAPVLTPAVKAAAPPPASPAEAPPQGARQGRVMTSPANRRRASEAGIDLKTVAGSGPGGRILRADLQTTAPRPAKSDAADTTEIKVIGLRRLIAERMSEAKRNIPHFAYVEEVDVTELESLRMHLNHSRPKDAGSLSYLPLVVMALTRVIESFPQCNVLYDAARGVLIRHRAVHVGIATQTPDGLKVPVVHNAQALGLWEVAAEIRRLAERARSNKATREELVGSTITVTSLGKLGGIASTPIINAPEVAIIGLNKAVERPVVHQGAVVVRRIMNLSSSFDHRFVDGYDAAAMIQALKERLEHPATIFIPTVKAS